MIHFLLFFCYIRLSFSLSTKTTRFNQPLSLATKPKFNGINLVNATTMPSNGRFSLELADDPQWDLASSTNYFTDPNTPVLKSTFNYTIPINMRVDTDSSIIINTSFLCNQCSSLNVEARVGVILASNSSLPLYLNFGKHNIPQPQGFLFFKKVISLVVNLFVKNTTDFQIDLKQNQIKSLEINRKVFNIIQILRDLCQENETILSCDQIIQRVFYEIKIPTQNNLVGIISFNSSLFIPRNCTTNSFILPMNQYQLEHYVPNNNLQAEEFGNVSRPCNDSIPTIDQFLFDYQFKSLTPESPIRAMTFLTRGLSFDSSVNALGFPISVRKNSIISIFQIKSTRNSQSNPKARVCHVISLMNNYNIFTHNFENSTNGSLSICRWSDSIHISTNTTKLTINNKTYFRHSYDNNSEMFFQEKPFPINSSFEFNLNLSKFFEDVPQFANYWIVKIRQGFVVYSQNITFQIKSSKILIENHNKFQLQFLSEQMKQAVQTVVSIPNVALLLRLAQILNLLDDLSYFVYHNTSYDLAFTQICNLSWGWVNSKWLPPSPVASLIGLNLSSSAEPRWVYNRETVGRFGVKGEGMAFIDNCRGFLVYTLLSSVLIFAVLWKIYWLLKDKKIAAVLSAFSSWAYLAVSLICDNCQYLAFRGFEQLRALQPTSTISLLSHGLAVIGLFISIICSFGLFLAAHNTAYHLFLPPILLRAIPSYKFLIIWTGSRFFAGFVHAMIDDPMLRISLLLSLQFIVTISAVASWHCTRIKTPHMALIVGQTARFILYLLICMEVVYPEIVGLLDNTGSVSELSLLLVQIVFIANSLQIFLTILVGVIVKRKEKIQIEKIESPKQTLQTNQEENKCKTKTKQKVIIKAKPLQSTKRKLAGKQCNSTQKQKPQVEQLTELKKNHLVREQQNKRIQVINSLDLKNQSEIQTKNQKKAKGNFNRYKPKRKYAI